MTRQRLVILQAYQYNYINYAQILRCAFDFEDIVIE